jgi:hypothetical protein
MTRLSKILFVHGFVVCLGLALLVPSHGQSTEAAAPASTPTAKDELLRRVQDLQNQTNEHAQQVEKRLDMQSDMVRKQLEASSRWTGLWSAVPTFVWVMFLSGLLFVFRGDLRQLLRVIVGRLRQGGSVKFGTVEIGAVIAIPARLGKTAVSRAVRDDDGRRRDERERYYSNARRVMLVHKLLPSTEEGELYDILIYVIPAINGSIAGVDRVEYYFGGQGWKYKIFTASDRSRGSRC